MKYLKLIEENIPLDTTPIPFDNEIPKAGRRNIPNLGLVSTRPHVLQ